MISSPIQLYSLFFSVLLGSLYNFILNLYLIKINYKKIYFRCVFHTIFILFISIIVINIYFKINGGFIHYSYLLFWIIGYFITNKVKLYVKQQKKSKYYKK